MPNKQNFFVIGNRASKSLSPLIFNYWFKKYKINAKYFFLETHEKNFDKTILEKVNDKNISGFNITIPFKKKILKHLDVKDKHATNIGAANCVKVGNKTKGINTDWTGYLNSIKKLKLKKNKKVLILGYGGAAQAIVYAFALKGFQNIIVFNRSKKLIKFKEVKAFTKKYSLIDRHLRDADIIINTTPTNPLKKKQMQEVGHKVVVSDIVYKPKHTLFLKGFKKNRKIYGISMLIEQAIPCFRLWFGFDPKVDEALLKKLNTKI
jgi:shikimate dehydrogenase